MAKVSSIVKNEKRKQLAAKHYQERAKLRAIIKDPSSSDDDVIVAQFTLNSKKEMNHLVALEIDAGIVAVHVVFIDFLGYVDVVSGYTSLRDGCLA